MKDEIVILIRKWFKSQTGIDLIHDPSLISLVNEIEALRIHDVVGRNEQFYCNCSRGNGLDYDEDGVPYCIECEKPVQ